MRRKYSLEFKKEVVQDALVEKSLSLVARKYRLNSKMIYRWVHEYKQGKFTS
ncbi:transposase [Acinetobacter baumannii]|uniref:transposase n=1 Tax=Acinetobacter baumannii TaxID=470 RepID=UPI0034D4F57C